MREVKEWSLSVELLAQLVEEVSLVAAEGYGRKKPREIPRPLHMRRRRGIPGRESVEHAVGVIRATARIRQRPGAA